jgi:hypothetical protein
MLLITRRKVDSAKRPPDSQQWIVEGDSPLGFRVVVGRMKIKQVGVGFENLKTVRATLGYY